MDVLGAFDNSRGRKQLNSLFNIWMDFRVTLILRGNFSFGLCLPLCGLSLDCLSKDNLFHTQ